MEITSRRQDDALELEISGRLDAYWADHLAAALEEALRGGADRIRLNMAAVTYMSSVGIRVLLRFYKQLQGMQGSFAVSQPSDAVKTVLELAGLETLLVTATVATAGAVEQSRVARTLERDTAVFEVMDRAPGAALRCRSIGDPELLSHRRFGAPHCRAVAFPEDTIGVGVGAFGRGFEECRGRFGEFLAAGGAAAYLPTDGTNVADYLVARAAFVPTVEVLYGIVCSGTFAHLARFEGAPGAGALTLTTLAQASLEIAGADAAGIVIVAESAGLVGAALRRSPAVAEEGEAASSRAGARGDGDPGNATEGSMFDHPRVREWLSFTPERAYMRSLALVVGIAARTEHRGLMPLVRPMSRASWPVGHFHAAAFSYRPLPRRDLDLKSTIATLFEAETVQGVLHLLTDDRDISGAGQSELVRGACWIGPITGVDAT